MIKIFVISASAIASILAVALVMRWVFRYTERRIRDRKISTEELQLKAEADLRKDMIQCILGVAILLTFIGTAANVIQGFQKIESDKVEAETRIGLDKGKFADDKMASDKRLAQEQRKIDDDEYARLLADLGSDSDTRQVEALNRLLARWQRDEALAVEHMRTIVTFLRLRAPMPIKLKVDTKYSDIPAVGRTRPSIQTAVDVLSELNLIKQKSPNKKIVVVMKDVDLRDLSFQGRCLQGLDLSGCLMGDSDFTGCSMEGLKAYAAFFEDATLVCAHLERSNLESIRATAKTNFSGAFVEGADLNDAGIDDVNGNKVTVLNVDKALNGNYVGKPKWDFKVVPAPPKTRPAAAAQE